MIKFLLSVGKEMLFFLAAIIGFCVSIITESVGIGFLTLALLVVSGVFFGRYYAQVRAAKNKISD